MSSTIINQELFNKILNVLSFYAKADHIIGLEKEDLYKRIDQLETKSELKNAKFFLFCGEDREGNIFDVETGKQARDILKEIFEVTDCDQ